MKILKIELQNINSLKSDTPIVIDFESNQFKDVGLYAITGSTGAGKTTILDAITIALYHNVPRFNKTKGTLLDVVSFGANDAFSRVAFENNNSIYEGYWGVRLANKSGVRLKNAIEEVSLKNLSTGKTIANQKRKYIEEIEQVTQLDYTQFLRSVMLAQGEFASFLSAKGPEKGKLLEQITGEEIYKKIGQHISERKTKEENKLKELESTINSEDTLKEEERIELTKQQNEIKILIAELEKQGITVKRIADWYEKQQKLVVEGKQIEERSEKVDEFIKKNSEELAKLELNEKAAVFKDVLQNIHRTEKSIKEKEAHIVLLTKELEALQPIILNLKTNEKTHSEALKTAETAIHNWLPKFDEILKIETDVKHLNETQIKAVQDLKEVNLTANALNLKVKTLNTSIQKTETALKSVADYTEKHKNIAEVATQISGWTTDLTTLKNKRATLVESNTFITEKQAIISKSRADLEIQAKKYQQEKEQLSDLEKQLKTISEAFEKQHLPDVIAKKDELHKAEKNWTLLKQLSEEADKFEKEKKSLNVAIKALLEEVSKNEKEVLAITKSIAEQEQLVADATRILDLEKSIKNYETDRLKLIKEAPCGLCGSTEHPFVDHGKAINISASEKELTDRKSVLLKLVESKNELEKRIGISKSNIETQTKQLEGVNEQLKVIKSKAKDLKLDCELSNIVAINAQLNIIKTGILHLEKELQLIQKLQLQKENFSRLIATQKERVHTSNTKIETLKQSRTHNEEEVKMKQKTIAELSETCTALENDLKTRLAVFNYQVPAPEDTLQFIKEIEQHISIFNSKTKQLVAFKNDFENLNLELTNTQKLIETNRIEQERLQKQLDMLTKNIEEKKAKRHSILPSSISVAFKRNELQNVKNKLVTVLEGNAKQLQIQLNLQREKEVLKEKNLEELKSYIQELGVLNTTLEKQLIDSVFENKQAVIDALLPKEDKDRIAKNKDIINEQKIKLATLKTAHTKNREALQAAKDFDIEEHENKLKIEELKRQHKELITASGGIVERFRKDQEIRDRNKDIYVKIDAQDKICGVWKQLFFLIGNSKDAFNVYVQRITLQNLLDLANIHLYNLNKRYSLQMEKSYKKGEELNFNLIDHYQTSQARLVDTSSGGEKFIISLALALGLSDLASKNVKIDSLFIDEGFGTLDNNTLETVISTLETLQSQGKVIGIISHVENLKERIPTQIKITKKSNGVSAVEVLS